MNLRDFTAPQFEKHLGGISQNTKLELATEEVVDCPEGVSFILAKVDFS